jgi:hypothetical protein
MNKKSLTMGMIIPMAATGAIATATPVSAAPVERAARSSVSCELTAERLRGDRIRLTLEVDSRGRQGDFFSIRITDNGNTVVRDLKRSRTGDFTITERVRDRRGTDNFRATVRNLRSDDSDTCRDSVGRRA